MSNDVQAYLLAAVMVLSIHACWEKLTKLLEEEAAEKAGLLDDEEALVDRSDDGPVEVPEELRCEYEAVLNEEKSHFTCRRMVLIIVILAASFATD